MQSIEKVENIKQLALLAKEIWFEYWPGILSNEQIEYMVEKFQSQKAIQNQIDNENYTYYFINVNNENAGYFGVSDKKEYLFLSKIYIKKSYRHKGIGTKAFNEIIKIAKSINLNKIRLTVNKHNINSINAYNKWGFKTIDSVVENIGNGFVMDDYIMEYQI